MNELKRSHAKQLVLGVVQNKDILGFEEVYLKKLRYQNSLQVCSAECEYLFLSTRNFRDKFLNNSIQFKKNCIEHHHTYTSYL